METKTTVVPIDVSQSFHSTDISTMKPFNQDT